MSSFLNRLKNLKTGAINFGNDGDNSSLNSFDEEGFLCPVCHRKFHDTSSLEHHYLQAHTEPESPTTNGNRKHDDVEDPVQEVSIWKQQFFTSEESRMQLSSELMQQKQRVGDLEEELESLQKQFRSAQTKVIEQSQEIGNLKATKDVYDAQLAMFTDELLNTQGELKEKQNQVDTLCNDLIPSLPTNDDVDVLKRELITVQQRMNDMSLEKEQQIDVLRRILSEISEDTKQFDELENRFNQNISMSEEILSNHTSDILTNLNLIHQQKTRINQTIQSMRTDLARKQKQIEELKQVNIDLEQRLTKDFQKQLDDHRNDYEQLEKQFEEIKQEKNQLLMNQNDQDQDNQRQNLVRQLTQEKEQFEQQIKDFKKQIKQINDDKFNEINTLNETIQDKERQLNELSLNHDQFRNDCQQSDANLRETHREEIQRLENEIENKKSQINEFENETNQLKQIIQQHEQSLSDLKLVQDEKVLLENQYQTSQQTIESLQTNISQLNSQLNDKNQLIDRFSSRIRHSIEFVHKIHQFLQEKIFTNQTDLFSILEQSEQELQNIRSQTREDIREELTNYLSIILENKIKFDKEIEENRLKSIQQQETAQKEYNELQTDYDRCQEAKKNLEIQLGEINQNLLQVSETLSETTRNAEEQREKFEKQINSLEEELTTTRSDIESRTKKSDMQLAALRENLSTVRSELKSAQEKLVTFEQIKNEKDDLQKRFDTLLDEKTILIERSLANENRNEKLLLENGQLAKKNSDLEYALQELAREYQGLQIQTNRVSERRWVNDHDIHECMKCNQTFTLTQRKHHCRNCGNVFCDSCSSKTAVIAATSKKPQRVCDQCYRELTS